MSEMEELGTRGEEYKYKIFYFGWVIFIFLFLFWSYIGNLSAREMVQFYIWMGLFALFFILFDNSTKKRFEYVDTVTIEKPRWSFLSPKLSFILALAFSVLLSYNIFTAKKAWVNYPSFQVFDNKLLNSFLSGACGVVENWVFFAFLFPTLYKILTKKFNIMVGLLLSLSISAFVFMTFHIFRYGYMESALLSTLIFAFVVELTIFTTKNMIIADMLHLTNNLVANLMSATVGLVIAI